MNELDKARDLIRRYSSGDLPYQEFIQQMSGLEIDVAEFYLTQKEWDDPVLEIGIRAQAAAERIRRL